MAPLLPSPQVMSPAFHEVSLDIFGPFEIRVTVNDCRSDTVGGLLVGLEIWRKACLPLLFNNSHVWVEIPKKAIDLLNHINNTFFRALFQSCKGNPHVMYYWDMKSLQSEYLVMLHKLHFLWHLAALPEDSLAKEVYNLQQEDKSLPSLVSECQSYLKDLKITEDPARMSKREWKKRISSEIHQKNKESLLDKMTTSHKLDIEKLS